MHLRRAGRPCQAFRAEPVQWAGVARNMIALRTNSA
jgi:hypothetical protein